MILFTDLPTWPRGLPLSFIKSTNSRRNMYGHSRFGSIEGDRLGVIQSLANVDPDVDAIYRLLMPIPFNFSSNHRVTHELGHSKTIKLLKIPEKSYTPYNAQATLHFYPALWSLWLPVTVHGRVSDIWRGYIYQKIAKDIGLDLLFSSPAVVQVRNSHNYLADFDSEQDLYQKFDKLVEQLSTLSLHATTLPGRIEELYIYLYEHGYLKLLDVHLCQEWIATLDAIDYKFPTVLTM